MSLPRMLVLVLAGGAGSRLELLTQQRAKPAVPYGGTYRLIDFALSNASHALAQDVWVVQQYHPASLSEHLSNGRPWDLDRTQGGLLVLHPQRGSDREGWHQGTADALWRQAPLISELNPDVLVVVSADAIYRMDYRDVAHAHLASDATVTMVTTEVDPEEAGRYGVVVARGEEVRHYAYKPEQPASATVSTEVFCFDAGRTLETLERIAGEVGEHGLADLGDHLLPRLVEAGEARAAAYRDYWRDVGTVEAYWDAHQDLVAENPPFSLDHPSWPIRTAGGRHGPARLLSGCAVDRSLLSPGCTVAGQVRGSVLSPLVVVEDGAAVVDSVLLPGAVVRTRARVERSVLDEAADVGAGAVVGGAGEITLLGKGARVPRGDTVPAGARLPDPSEE